MKISLKWLFCLLAILFLILSAGIFYATEKQASQKVVSSFSHDYLQNLTRNLVSSIEHHLVAGSSAGRIIQYRIEKDEGVGENIFLIQQSIIDQLVQHPQISAVYIASVRGEFLYAMRDQNKWSNGLLLKRITGTDEERKGELVFVDPANREVHVALQKNEDFDPRKTAWFADVVRMKEVSWTKPYVFYETKNIGITMLQPLFSRSDEPWGVLGVDVELESISLQLARWREKNSGQILVLDEAGTAVMSSEPISLMRPDSIQERAYRLVGIDELDNPIAHATRELRNFSSESSHDSMFLTFYQGDEKGHVQFTLYPDPSVPWKIGAYLPQSRYMFPLIQAIKHGALGASGLAIAAVFLALGLGGKVSRSLGDLKEAMNGVLSRDYHGRVLKDCSISEISAALSSFTKIEKGISNLHQTLSKATSENLEKGEKLQKIEAKIDGILASIENFSEAFIVLDRTYNIIFVNKAAADLLETNVGSIFNQEFPFPILIRESMEIEIQSKSKKPTIAEMFVVETKWEGKDAYLVALRDISERKYAEESLSKSNKDLENMVGKLKIREEQLLAITSMAKLFHVCSTPREVYDVIAENMDNLFPVDGGAVYIMDEAFNIFSKIHGWGDQAYCPEFFTSHDCWALKTGDPHSFKPGESLRFCRHINEGTPIDKECLCVPMITNEDQIGLIYLQYSQIGLQLKFGKGEQDIITSIWELCMTTADHIAIALTNVRLQEKLQESATKDPLTGVYNRRYMLDFFTGEIFRAERKGTPIGVIILDIDHFKKFNDRYGHDAGDLVLKITGSLIIHGIRKGDICCRFGGEEFVLILPGSSYGKTMEKAEEIRARVEGHKFYLDKKPLAPVTISLGVSSYPQHGRTVPDLIKVADNALYEAKAQGRNRVCGGGA